MVPKNRVNASSAALQVCGAHAQKEAAPPRFSFVPNVVAYPGQEPEVSVGLAAGSLDAPATLRYALTLQTPAAQRFLPASAMSGILQFAPGDAQRKVAVPISWSRVPPEAEYRLGLELQGLHNAQASNQGGDVAVHVFGVDNGTCPPGSAVKAAASKAAPRQGWWQDTELYAAAPDAEPTAGESQRKMQQRCSLGLACWCSTNTLRACPKPEL